MCGIAWSSLNDGATPVLEKGEREKSCGFSFSFFISVRDLTSMEATFSELTKRE